MTCCHCQATDSHFGAEVADRDLRRYRRRGPDKSTRILLDAVRGLSNGSSTLLDIGGGIGAICHELCGDGMSATHVEAASAYAAAAEREARERGHADRMRFVHGDCVEIADILQAADVVTLDRVVCCYPDYRELIEASAKKCIRLYALSLPRTRWYVKAALGFENLLRRLKGDDFRAFVHPEKEVEALLEQAGLKQRFSGGTFVWRVDVYAKPDAT